MEKIGSNCYVVSISTRMKHKLSLHTLCLKRAKYHDETNYQTYVRQAFILSFYCTMYVFLINFKFQRKYNLLTRKTILESYRIFQNIEKITLLTLMEIETADYHEWIELEIVLIWMLGFCMHKRPIQVRKLR